MEWHVITGSKGGVGKTLLSLLLLIHCLEDKKRKEGTTLILDLNGMNTDSSALILHRNKTGQKDTTIELKTSEKLYHLGAGTIKLQTISNYIENKEHKYVVGWPQNPFMLMNPQLFADLLTSITLNTEKIEKELELSSPLRYIIADTNYHFCNIFAQEAGNDCYKVYKNNDETLRGEKINIWFLWVYRQLEKLLDDSNEATAIKNTATAIEKILTGSYGSESPFIHVFTPIAMMETLQAKSKLPFSFTKAQKNDGDYAISEFEKLEKEKFITHEKCITFLDWVTKLNDARNNSPITDLNEEDESKLFPKVLLEAIKKMDNKRPQNIIPISVYQSALKNYTDKQRPDAIARLRKMKIYKHLSTLLK